MDAKKGPKNELDKLINKALKDLKQSASNMKKSIKHLRTRITQHTKK